jgi:predicted transposase YdaD
VEFNRFDVSAKELIWDDPAAWLDRLGIGAPGPVTVVDSDITTLTAAADKVIRVDGPQPYLVNFELQSSNQTDLVETTWFRQAALFHRHRLPVLTVLVLLRRDANAPSVTGRFEMSLPDGWLANQYNYRVVRIWQDDPEAYLTAGVNLVPLAPLTNIAEEALPGLVQRMADRINAEPQPRAAMLWTATYLLLGLRFSNDFAYHLLEGVHNMQESTTYQAILEEGRNEGLVEGRNEGLVEGRNEGLVEGRNEGLVEGRNEGLMKGRVTEAQRLLMMLGEERFGEPDGATRDLIEATHDLERLERLTKRVIDTNVHDWIGLVSTT